MIFYSKLTNKKYKDVNQTTQKDKLSQNYLIENNFSIFHAQKSNNDFISPLHCKKTGI